MKRKTSVVKINAAKDDEAIEHEVSSGNIFADLGLPDAEELFFKGHLAIAIQRMIEDAGWTQREAAERVGVSQPDLSNLLNGRLAGFSTDRLLKILNRLGSDIEIRISTKARVPSVGHTSVVFA